MTKYRAIPPHHRQMAERTMGVGEVLVASPAPVRFRLEVSRRPPIAAELRNHDARAICPNPKGVGARAVTSAPWIARAFA